MQWRNALVGVIVVLSAACGASEINTGPVACGSDSPALIVLVRDSISGAFAGGGVTVTATSAAYSFTATTAPGIDAVPRTVPGGPGTYTLTARKTGYRDWTKNGIQVAAEGTGPCAANAKTVEVTVLLAPTS